MGSVKQEICPDPNSSPAFPHQTLFTETNLKRVSQLSLRNTVKSNKNYLPVYDRLKRPFKQMSALTIR